MSEGNPTTEQRTTEKRSYCAWRGTAARGIYSVACKRWGYQMGVPSSTCPNCGRPIQHYVSKPKKMPTLADYQEWKAKQGVCS